MSKVSTLEHSPAIVVMHDDSGTGGVLQWDMELMPERVNSRL